MNVMSEPPLGRFEERLLAELKTVVAAHGAPDHVPEQLPRGKQRRTWSPRLRARAAAITALGLSAAVAAGVVVATVTRPPARPASRYSLAAEFLNRAAAAARAQNTPLPGPDQVFYSKLLVVAPGPHGGIRECLVSWMAYPLIGAVSPNVSGGRCTSGVPPLPPGAVQLLRQKPVGHAYPPLNTLPTSAAALRSALYAAAARGGAYWGLPTFSTDQIVFQLIDSLLSAPISGAQRAALYELIAQVPGVTLVRDAIDAAGRHGTGIVMRFPHTIRGPQTLEIILAPRTYSVLGATQDMPGQGVHFANLGSGLVTLPRS